MAYSIVRFSKKSEILYEKLYAVADLHGKILDVPRGPIFFIPMQFSVKFGNPGSAADMVKIDQVLESSTYIVF